MAQKPKLTEAQKRRLKAMQDYPDETLVTSNRNAAKVLDALRRKGLVKPSYGRKGDLFEVRWNITEEGKKYVIRTG